MRIFIIIIFLFTTNFIIAQKYTLPQEVIFYGDLQSDDFEGDNFGLHDSFFPIGWSTDGKFAYLKESADEAGSYFIGLYIQNAITDKIIEKKVYYSDADDELNSITVNDIWKKHYATFEYLLSQHSIKKSPTIELIKKSSFNINNNKYDIKLKSKRDDLEGMNYFDAITRAEIYLSCKGLGIKRVYSYSEREGPNVLDIDIIGYIKSPWEDRIIIISKEKERGYEGPPNVHGFIITGAHLTKGFK